MLRLALFLPPSPLCFRARIGRLRLGTVGRSAVTCLVPDESGAANGSLKACLRLLWCEVIVSMLFAHAGEITMPGPLVLSPEFNRLLGMFHYNWAATDIHVDYAVWQFLNVTPLQAHLITSGVLFGRKVRLLVDLIKHSEDKRNEGLLRELGRLTKSNRDMIAHAWLRSTDNAVTFLERKASGTFAAKEHTFTLQEFSDHVTELADAGQQFRRLLGVSSAELDAFAKAALSARLK